jgi:hypothetical protein
MSDQNKNAQPSPFEKDPKNAGGIDDIEEGEDRVEEDDSRQAGGNRRPESEEPGSSSDSSDGR